MHDSRSGVHTTQRLKKERVVKRVQTKVLLWIDHRRGVAHLAGQVEHDIGSLDEITHAGISNTCHEHINWQRLHVVHRPAVTWHKFVNDSHRCTIGHERRDEV